jgi:hypothetical protein
MRSEEEIRKSIGEQKAKPVIPDFMEKDETSPFAEGYYEGFSTGYISSLKWVLGPQDQEER